jgi:ribonucleoside-diphosphate reductase subunit M1
MFVIKRDGRKEKMYYDKITARNMKLASDLSVDTSALSQTVIAGLVSGMTTRDIDQLSCESAIYRGIYERDYGILASRIAWNDLHKNTPSTFKEAITLLYNNFDRVKNKHNPLISLEIYNFALQHINRIESAIDYNRDYDYSYFAFKILQKSYLQRVDGKTVERCQTMLMREALGVHGPSIRNSERTGREYKGDIEKVIDTYNRTSRREFTHASPTKFSAGTNRPQMSSCFLLSCPDSMGDEIYDYDDQLRDISREESIPECWKHCAKISKLGGGIGVDLTCVRPRGSLIGGTNSGRSGGIIPLIKVFNSIGRYVDQSGKRKGAIALYLQPWHSDIEEFLELRLKTTSEESRALDIFPALWIPRLFFKRLERDEMWSLFDSHEYPELVDLYGDSFERRYEKLERDCKFTLQIKAKSLWEKVLKSLDETGLPYIHNKDEVNEKSNQREGTNGDGEIYSNLVSIRGSNLCCEIMQNHTPTSIATCNLISVALSRFVHPEKSISERVDWKGLGDTVETANENLNMIIDKNYYPVDYCADNNFDYRPQGIGPQDLAGAFARLGISWENKTAGGWETNREAKVLNQLFSECMYFHALKRSNELAKIYGPYPKFNDSPASQGILQFDMWTYRDPFDTSDPLNGTTIVPFSHPRNNIVYSKISNIPPNEWNSKGIFSFSIPVYDWDGLKQSIKEHGLLNSLLIAPMPTATTSQILGNSECFEPFTSNVFARKGVAGDFPCVNEHLARDLDEVGMWNREIVNSIVKNNGSVQSLNIPQDLKDRYKTVWEISQRTIIDFASDRGAFCDQSQSMNIYLSRPTPSKLSSLYMYGFKKGLKTLSYYLRSESIVDPVKFSIMDESDPIRLIKKGMDREEENKRNIEEGKGIEEDASGSCSLGGGACSS